MVTQVTPTREDYLREIYKMQEARPGEVRLTELAERLALSKSTVTERIAEMADAGLVSHESYGGVKLTAKGRALGEELTYRHRVIETFLANVLGLKGTLVHAEAHKMEHACGSAVIDAMRRLIPDAPHCPDGSPILRRAA